MASIVDSLPPWARTSTTGQGIAGAFAAVSAVAANHFLAPVIHDTNTLNQVLGLVAIAAGSVALVLFPQASKSGVAPASEEGALDIEKFIAAVRLGHNLKTGNPSAILTGVRVTPQPQGT